MHTCRIVEVSPILPNPRNATSVAACKSARTIHSERKTMTEISPEATLSAMNVACKTWTDSTLIRLGSRSICLGLEVSELGADRTLHLIDLGSELRGRGATNSIELVKARQSEKGEEPWACEIE